MQKPLPIKLNPLLTCTLAALFLMFTGPAKADNYSTDGQKSYDKAHDKINFSHIKKLKEELNLTSEQKKQLKSMKSKLGKDSMKKKHAEMAKAYKDLEMALQSEASDDDIREKFNNLQKLQEDFARTRFEKILFIRSILTPEQRAKFNSLIGKE